MPQQLTIDQAMSLGLGHQQAGRLAQAEQLYRLILQHNPNHVEAMHHLGLIAQRVGKLDAAADLMSRSVAIAPTESRYHSNFGTVLVAQGKFQEALACYARALQLAPWFAEAHYNQGDALRKLGRFEESAAAMAKSLQLKPDFALAWTAIGAVKCELAQYDDAIDAFNRALRLQPNSGDAYAGLGIAYTRMARAEEAIAACRRGIELEPQRADHYNHLGTALTLDHRLEEAEAAHRKAIELKPVFLEAYTNLGNVLTDMLRLDEAIAAYERAKQIDPNCPDPHYNQGWAFLLRGDFERGWPAHERRWGTKNIGCKPTDWGRPQWKGEDIAGKTIFLHVEQGFGDAIQFIRYVPLLANRGARIMLGCLPPVLKLFRGVPGIDQFILDGVIPPFDLHCPLMSLPLAFGTRMDTIPASIPYLAPDAGQRETWLKKVRDVEAGDSQTHLKVGLAWSGNTDHPKNYSRSIPLTQLAPFFDVAGVRFFSLQLGKGAAQAAHLPGEAKLIDLTADLRDFSDTAALIEQLDLVITVDTAVAHLAGALGKPVWTLLTYKPDWRWMLDRADSPWYPTMRLFRQPRPGEWGPAIDDVRKSLEELSAGNARGGKSVPLH